MWEEYAKDPAHALEWQQTYMNFMFDLEDSSGEYSHACFSADEYVCVFGALVYYAFARREIRFRLQILI